MYVFSNPFPPLMFPSPPATLCWSNDTILWNPELQLSKVTMECDQSSVGASFPLFSPFLNLSTPVNGKGDVKELMLAWIHVVSVTMLLAVSFFLLIWVEFL